LQSRIVAITRDHEKRSVRRRTRRFKPTALGG